MNRRTALPIMSDDHPASFQYFVVAYFDLLGQRALLEHLGKLPKSTEESQVFLTNVRQTLGNVEKFRSLINSYFDTDRENRLRDPPTALQAIPEASHILNYLRQLQISFQGFGDTVISYCPITDSAGNPMVHPVGSLLTACAAVMVHSLAIGIYPRGVIDIGVGVEAYPSELYGFILSKCAEQEASLVVWPRVLVGDQLADYLRRQSSGNESTLMAKTTRQLAANYSRWIGIDPTDQRPIVDYLSPHPLNALKDYPNLAIKAEQNIRARIAHFATNSHLRGKYECVLQYIESRRDFSSL